jgi:hypothetical protein
MKKFKRNESKASENIRNLIVKIISSMLNDAKYRFMLTGAVFVDLYIWITLTFSLQIFRLRFIVEI